MEQISKTFVIKLTKGMKLSTVVTAKGGFQSDVVIKDGANTIVQVTKPAGGCDFKLLYPISNNCENKYCQLKDGVVTIKVTFTQSGSWKLAPEVKTSKSANALISEYDGSFTGYTYTFAFEDSTDDDYGDLMITLIANVK